MPRRPLSQTAPPGMTLDALRVFCAVVQDASFQAAARRLNRSQPAISQQLKGLEQKLGHTLLDRKTCKPTPAGDRLYARARTVLNEADGLARELADFGEAQVPVLRVGASDTTALYLLPPVVKAFSETASRTRLELVSRPTEAIVEKLLRGELDLALVTLPVSHPHLESRELMRQQLVLIAPADHPLARRKSVSIESLSGTPLLLLDEHTRTGALLRDHFYDLGFNPEIVMDSGSFEVIKRYVAEGVGVAFLPQHAITPADRGIRQVPVKGLPAVPLGAVRRKGAFQSRAEAGFMALLATHASPMAAQTGHARRPDSGAPA